MATRALAWHTEIGTSTVRPELRTLWAADPWRSPFASPSFLRAMHELSAGAGAPVWALGRTDEGDLAAAWPLRMDARRRLRFLPVCHSDQNTCLARPGVSVAELATGLARAVRETGARGVVLHNLPPWGPTLDATREAFGRLGWPQRAFPAWSCPVLRTAPTGTERSHPLKSALESHKRVRGYANALGRDPSFAFEVLEDGAELRPWCHEFCDVHESRWRGTATPSTYESREARAILLRVLESWSADGVLVRFAIRLADRRVALVAALRAGGRLVYYHVARSPEAERVRAGHVLIRLIGLWMSDRGFDTLDFGAGDEDYKSRYANADDALWRLFAAPRLLSGTLARGIVERRIRSSPTLLRAWSSWGVRGRDELSRWLAFAGASRRHVTT